MSEKGCPLSFPAAAALPDALVLVGGFGLRLRTAVPHLPKPMAAVNRKPFLEILLERLLSEGVKRVIMLSHYKSDVISAYFGHGNRWGVAIEHVHEPEPYGTGGAVIHAVRRCALTEAFLLLNGDSFIDASLRSFIGSLSGAPAGIVLTPSPDPDRYGVVTMTENGMIDGFSEKSPACGSPFVNAGVYRFPPQWFHIDAPLPCSLERDLIPAWLAEGRRIRGYVHKGFFVDMGTPEGYARCRRWFAEDTRQ